ncbi:imidazole glycerol phosphate synthase subunit HisH [Capillimicrobium parvum]|uniref:Imidazole glycerol phosphate synthase subunit HisH n=1 Tax=Capillimicrobium parvum TaxID=2884022 RepID=A0A9E6XXP8_9ACTN|nr:imidazole glycerol phosphate synthase subunit HisH [Capillimicrobium parvum]UGS36303.1 Imidazole glycerol phosphate synthase subunit HisH [Capillimicrobium parvum]
MTGATIAIVDYGMGNRRSVEKALEHVGARALISREPGDLRAADGLLLPGVGAFPAAMRTLRELDLEDVLLDCARGGMPFFGSCMGMQLLFESSEEHGGATGLGLLRGSVRRLDSQGRKLPHIGWNEVRWVRESPLLDGLPDPSTFYHVHTYVPHPSDQADVLGISDYGSEFASVVARDNVFGAQFHPEKSSTHGLALLRNFARLCDRVAA